MSNNCKNLLQELCAKNKLSLPTYGTVNVQQNKCLPPIWLSTVDMTVKSQKISRVGTEETSKVKAEVSAASCLLPVLESLIGQSSSPPISSTGLSTGLSTVMTSCHNGCNIQNGVVDGINNVNKPSDTKGIYLIDLENVPLITGQRPVADQLWIGFISQTHATVDKYGDWYRSVTPLYKYMFGFSFLYILDNQGRKDMMDHYITAFTYNIAKYVCDNNITVPIYIVSKDLAAWCSKSCLQFWLQDVNMTNTVTVLSKM